jgi:hypothetical protein
LTIGYGDVVTKTVEGKLATIIYATFGIYLGFFLLISLERPLNSKPEHNSHINITDDSYFNSESFVPVCILLWYVFSSLVFKLLEAEWTFVDSFYFCFVTMTGVGYGDFTP